ncbi:sodium:proton antiporter [Methanosalsum natronophilum]|uniref:Sodium:proton antiporter n=1 Tax=Methanosalsum natronophilum TaxID=768733 RepID=A0A424YXW1_9EURY|nr:sodium:proton antiporter [Methanosalsum natronophilum]MCS3924389.1 hypothetical protein [Methanosalsum natronophilum]RQD85314.1 MAG: sodium:proton antiporter [Methanosalsum natronophilum]
MDKRMIENIKHLNDSLIVVLILMPATIIIVFEAIATIPELRILSIITWIIYLCGLGYVSYRLIYLNNKLNQYLKDE